MNRKTKWSHRLLALAMAAVMCCTYLPVGAFAETPPQQESTVAAEKQQTDETETDSGQTDASNPDPGALQWPAGCQNRRLNAALKVEEEQSFSIFVSGYAGRPHRLLPWQLRFAGGDR